MNEIVGFLNARLRDEEQMARAADGVTWTATKGLHDFSDGGGLAEMVTLTDSEGTPIVTDLDGTFSADDLVHIARHDPARVLREVEAKQRIVDLHHPDRHLENWYWTERKCAECDHLWHRIIPGRPPTEIGPETGCATIQLLALPYADHPDYRKEWAL